MPARPGAGRPRKMTKEDKDKIIDWIGNKFVSRKTCCERLKIDMVTLNAEIDRDPEFSARVDAAEFHCRDGCVEGINTSADWRAKQFLLKCKYWREFGKTPDTYTKADMLEFAVKISDILRKYVPADQQLSISAELETIITEIEAKKKAEATGS